MYVGIPEYSESKLNDKAENCSRQNRGNIAELQAKSSHVAWKNAPHAPELCYTRHMIFPTTRSVFFALGIYLLLGCAGTLNADAMPGQKTTGLATWYADKLHGRTTASGEKYDKNAMTAAHRELPFGTVVRVVNLANMKSVQVRINDRGPFNDKKRIIDLSRAAATQIDMIQAGVVEVEIEILQRP